MAFVTIEKTRPGQHEAGDLSYAMGQSAGKPAARIVVGNAPMAQLGWVAGETEVSVAYCPAARRLRLCRLAPGEGGWVLRRPTHGSMQGRIEIRLGHRPLPTVPRLMVLVDRTIGDDCIEGTIPEPTT